MNSFSIKENLQLFGFFSCLFILYSFFIYSPGHPFDTFCWKAWSKYAFENGLENIYKSKTDYLPLYHYILFLFAKTQGSVEKIEENIAFLRLFTLFFNFVSTYFITKILNDHFKNFKKAALYSLFYICNIAILYNTLVWGQIDAILTCFVFLSIYFGYRKKNIAAVIFFVLAINIKLQAIIFLPTIGLIILNTITEDFKIKKVLAPAFALVATQTLILLPFIMNGTVGNIWNVVIGSFGKYPKISMNAHNIWTLLLDGDLMQREDSETAFRISFKNWGLATFFVASFFALFPIVKNMYNRIFLKKQNRLPLVTLLASTALIPLIFFFFNTQMHERYSHPALLFAVLCGILAKKPHLAILPCLAYLLNMESVLKVMGMSPRLFFLRPHFPALLYFASIISFFAYMYSADIRTFVSKIKHAVN